MENNLYHYTNFVSFDSILQNDELRVNNVLNMNDAMEMRLFMEGLSKAVCDKFIQNHQEEKIEKIQNIFNEELKNEFYYSSYAACFSKFRDDASQWERYGNRGKGVCIAFNQELLEKVVQPLASLETVFYQEDMAEHNLVPLFYEKITNEEDIRDLLDEAWICSAAFKHPSFASEREVRLVVTPFAKDYLKVQPRYHVTNERIKKYYPLNLNKMCIESGIPIEKLINEIIIGPESSQSLPILQDYLEDIGKGYLMDKVNLSSCPLRKSGM